VSDFLNPAWIEERNAQLATRGSAFSETIRVSFIVTDAPASGHGAVTLTCDAQGARLDLGDHLMADVLITMNADSAAQLASGSMTAARAIELGLLKVRGDGNVLARIAPDRSATLGAA
jgi:hypothetical protein